MAITNYNKRTLNNRIKQLTIKLAHREAYCQIYITLDSHHQFNSKLVSCYECIQHIICTAHGHGSYCRSLSPIRNGRAAVRFAPYTQYIARQTAMYIFRLGFCFHLIKCVHTDMNESSSRPCIRSNQPNKGIEVDRNFRF